MIGETESNETEKPVDKKPVIIRKKPGPKKGSRRRGTSDMNSDEAAIFNSHRIDKDNPGRLKPERGEDRVAFGQQRNLDNVHNYIASEHRGYWFLEHNVDSAVGGGYGLVKDHNGDNIRRTKGRSALYLMQLPIELWKQDQAAKHRRAQEAMGASVTIDPNKSEYGNDENQSITVNGMGYSPLF